MMQDIQPKNLPEGVNFEASSKGYDYFINRLQLIGIAVSPTSILNFSTIYSVYSQKIWTSGANSDH